MSSITSTSALTGKLDSPGQQTNNCFEWIMRGLSLLTNHSMSKLGRWKAMINLHGHQ